MGRLETCIVLAAEHAGGHVGDDGPAGCELIPMSVKVGQAQVIGNVLVVVDASAMSKSASEAVSATAPVQAVSPVYAITFPATSRRSRAGAPLGWSAAAPA
jgi:hypothetical protein